MNSKGFAAKREPLPDQTHSPSPRVGQRLFRPNFDIVNASHAVASSAPEVTQGVCLRRNLASGNAIFTLNDHFGRSFWWTLRL